MSFGVFMVWRGAGRVGIADGAFGQSLRNEAARRFGDGQGFLAFFQGGRNISGSKQGVAFDGSQPFTEQKAAAQKPGGFMSSWNQCSRARSMLSDLVSAHAMNELLE